MTILDCYVVTIGNNVMMGPNVNVFGAGHPRHPTLRSMELEYGFPITIEDDVWIGQGTTINAHITIGENTIIGY